MAGAATGGIDITGRSIFNARVALVLPEDGGSKRLQIVRYVGAVHIESVQIDLDVDVVSGLQVNVAELESVHHAIVDGRRRIAGEPWVIRIRKDEDLARVRVLLARDGVVCDIDARVE